MIKSPVEGNSVVLLKMDEPLVFSDFARPICIPQEDEFVIKNANCITLGKKNSKYVGTVASLLGQKIIT